MKTEASIDRHNVAQIIDKAAANRARPMRRMLHSQKVGRAVRQGGLMVLIAFSLAFISTRHVNVDPLSNSD